MSEERRFKTLYDFMQHCHELTEEEYALELKEFSTIERANIGATEYIEAGVYPAAKFDRANMKLWMIVEGKKYYPIVGWNPDLMSPFAGEGIRIPPMRKWLNRLPKRKIHNERENRTYVLYG